MDIKRILSGAILFPIFAAIIIFGNTYVVDIFVSIIAILCLHEFYKAFKGKAKPITWVGYVAAVLIALIHIIPTDIFTMIMIALIPVLMLILFTTVIITDMKRNIIDIAVTLLGICYIVIFLMFAPVIRESLSCGKILIWYVFFATWGTDMFAFFIGRKFGKHKFTEISPNKSIEGCIAGVIGAVILTLIYTIVCNTIFQMSINYIFVAVITVLLSIIAQIGDLAASSIKRYCEIKDYSNLIPGHGGILDRSDSVIFALPFAYFLLALL